MGCTMSETLSSFASKISKAADNLPSLTEREVKRLAFAGAGFMKTSIQDYHAVDTSTMLNSVRVEPVKGGFRIGPTVHYAAYVALGTSRMRARPFHTAAARRLEDAVKQLGYSSKDLGL